MREAVKWTSLRVPRVLAWAGMGAGASFGSAAGQPGGGGSGGLSTTQKILLGVLVPIGALLLAAIAAVVALRSRTVDALPESDLSVGISGGSGRVRPNPRNLQGGFAAVRLLHRGRVPCLAHLGKVSSSRGRERCPAHKSSCNLEGWLSLRSSNTQAQQQNATWCCACP